VKASYSAPSNIAFVKYWGARDLERAIPNHASISMTLDRCRSLCTVEALDEPGDDEVWLVTEQGERLDPGESFKARVFAHLDRLRRHFGVQVRFVVGTRNTFPSAAGIASSASGFAALTCTVVAALGREADAAELSLLARRSGSGSAARSVMGGYVEWPLGESDEQCYAFEIAPAEHWPLCDVVAIVQSGPKTVSSLDGHLAAASSPHYALRVELVGERLEIVRQAIRDRDLGRMGPVLEEEFIEMHCIAMSSRPAVFYWSPATLAVLARLRELREDGLEGWATMDAGANVHVICPPGDEESIAEALAATPGVEKVLRDRVGSGPETLEEELI
jgi:diphosphomevalonate decarboxylase